MSGNGHRVHFSYWLHAGMWNYRFIDEGLTVLGPVRRASSASVIRLIAERGRGFIDLEAKNMFDYGIIQGRGGLYLSLTENQYAILKNHSPN